MIEFGVARSIDLIPGGSDIAVTAENRQEYIQLMCKYKLDKQIAAQSRAFFHGLSDLIDSKCTYSVLHLPFVNMLFTQQREVRMNS